MRNKGTLINIVTIILTFLQLSIFFSKENTPVEILSYTDLNLKTTFKEIDNELKSIGNIKVIELREDEGVWEGKISLKGKKSEVIEILDKLQGYKIDKYNINGNGEVFEVFLEIYR